MPQPIRVRLRLRCWILRGISEFAWPLRLEFKAGYTSSDADETYTGLTEEDLDRNPDRRSAATRFDNFESDHFRTPLKWIAGPSDALRLEAADLTDCISRYVSATWSHARFDGTSAGLARGGHLFPCRAVDLD